MTEALRCCLYFGTKDECPNCGGWTKAGGIVELDGVMVDCGPKGPFHALNGITYCSEDCAEEATEFRSRLDAQRPVWCSACGYDNNEHAEDCPTLVKL